MRLRTVIGSNVIAPPDVVGHDQLEHRNVFGRGDVWTFVAIDADTKGADVLRLAADKTPNLVNLDTLSLDTAYPRLPACSCRQYMLDGSRTQGLITEKA